MTNEGFKPLTADELAALRKGLLDRDEVIFTSGHIERAVEELVGLRENRKTVEDISARIMTNLKDASLKKITFLTVQAAMSQQKLQAAEEDNLRLKEEMKNLKAAWRECHRGCGDTFHKAYCPLFEEQSKTTPEVPTT